MTERGAFPGRYPGILAKRPKLFAMESHSFDTSSGGNSICSFETEPGCFSTSTFIKRATVVAALVSSAEPNIRRLAQAPLQFSFPAHKLNAFVEIRTSTRSRDNLRNPRSR